MSSRSLASNPDSWTAQRRLYRLLGGSRVGAPPDDHGWADVARVTPLMARPLLAARLRDIGLKEAVPQSVYRELESAERAATLAGMQRQAVLRSMLEALERAGIETVLLKGAALAHLVYPRPELRPMSDIDLWVPVEALEAAAQTLVSAGLRFPDRFVGEGEQLPWLAARVLEMPDTPVVVELHGRVRSFDSLSEPRIKQIWDRRRPFSLHDRTALTLAREDLLLHVGLHVAAAHRFAIGPLPLVDVHLMLDRWGTDIDWASTVSDYRDEGVLTWMYLVFTLARDLLDAPVPSAFFDATPVPPHLEELQRLATEQTWAANRSVFGGLNRVLQHGSLWARLQAASRRLLSHYWERGSGPPRTIPAAVRDAGRRLWNDGTVKIPRYARAFWRGDLRGTEFRDRAALARKRGVLAELVDRDERHAAGRT